MNDIAVEQPAESKRLGRLLCLAAAVVSLLYNVEYLFFRFNPFGFDFRVFWAVARTPLATVYTASDAPFVYPPTALIFFKPLALVPFAPGYLIWSGISVAALMLAVVKIANIRVASFSLLSAGALQGLALGQTSMLLGAGVLFAVALSPMWCGVVIGLVAAIKPQLVFFAPLIFLLRKNWPALLGFSGAVAFCVVLELLVLGPTLWIRWLEAFPAFKDTLIRIQAIEEVIAPAGAAEQIGLGLVGPFVLAALIAALVCHRFATQVEGLPLAALIVGASIFVSPYALRHDTVALVPACISYILARPGLRALPACGVFSGSLVTLSLIAMALGLAMRKPAAPTAIGQSTPL